MAKIVYLFVLVASIQVAYALKCYNCGGATTTACPADIKGGPTVDCSPVAVGTLACLEQASIDKATNKETFVRKCVSAETIDAKLTYNCVTGSTTCKVCTTDLCNSASGVRFSFVTLLGVAAVFLIPKFM